MKLCDILQKEHMDFQEFCNRSGKVSPSDLSNADYIAFRTQYGVDRCYVAEIKEKINSVVSEKQFFQNQQETRTKSNDEEITDLSDEGDGKMAVDSIIKPIEKENLLGDESNNNCAAESLTDNGHIHYDVRQPLYIIFGLDCPEQFSDVGINAIGLSKRMEGILKENRRKTVYDVLICSVSQIFDLSIVDSDTISKTLDKLREFVSNDVNSVAVKIRQQNVPFYKLFEVDDLEDYRWIPINKIDFGTRFNNALKRRNILFFYDFLQYSINDIQGWGKIGISTIANIVKECLAFFNTSKKPPIKIHDRLHVAEATLNRVATIIDSEIHGSDGNIGELTEKEKTLYLQVKQAIDVCGKDFYLQVKENPEYAMTLINLFRSFYQPILDSCAKKEMLMQLYHSIPRDLKEKDVKLLYSAFSLRYDIQINFLSQIQLQTTLDTLFKDVPIDEVIKEYQAMERYLQWVKGIDLLSIVKSLFSQDILGIRYKDAAELKDKYWVVLEMRAEGETLENIGVLIGTTRERVRQVEQKFTKRFASNYLNNDYDLLAVIHALRGGDDVLTKEEVAALIGEKNTNLLWLALSKELLDCKMYRYSKEYDAVLFINDDKNNEANLQIAFSKLPEIVLCEKLDDIVEELSNNYRVSKELISSRFKKEYKQYGTVYSRTSLTVIFMCDYILKTKYPYGFKIGDEAESKRFQSYLIETFGDKKGVMTRRALDSKVSEIGILCDRGKYLHPDYFNVDATIITAINTYIEENDKTVVTYSEVFDALQSTLNGSQITNRFALQGALKYYGCKYTLRKDFITKEKDKNLTDEFETFAKVHGEFSKKEFFAAFPSMTDANLAMLTSRCRNVISIDYGYYMHSSMLNIIDSDYDQIRKYLNDACSECPVSSRFLYDEFSYRFGDFISRNEITNHAKLFGILYYMFGDEFIFSRPFISKEDASSLTNKDVILRYLEGVDTITIEDAVAMCQERGIRVLSSGYLIRQISPNYIRINETTLMRFELTGVNDDVILEVADYVAKHVETDRYCSVATIKDFLWFPTISIDWTSYLVESIMCLSGDMIGRISIPTSSLSNMTSIYVGEEYAEDDYATFILKISDEAFEKGFFTTKAELREFLYEKGLINNDALPAFLEGTEYYYMDEEGILRRRS